MTAHDRPGFRPDLEGLRAVAIVLVLLFHARVPGFRGGYVGVDAFFVLSGFLITGLLVRELRSTGRISLPTFYARRARRLLPAAVLTLAVTALAAAIILPPLRGRDAALDIAAAGAYVSNIRFALQATDYLASELPPSPVLHFWSLGVEEQFYLFWPALVGLVAGSRFAAGREGSGIRRVTIALVVTVAVSLALGVWLTGVQGPWAFFSLPSRAWELAVGGLLAMPAAARLAGPRSAPWLGWAGITLLVASGLVFDEATPFPGIAALAPVIGSALVIVAGGAAVASSSGARWLPAPAILLSLPPVRYVGRISYSLYLWHWPIFVLAAIALGPLSGPARLVLLGVTVVVAAVSQRFVEEPFHRGRFAIDRSARTIAAAATSSLMVAVLGLGLATAFAAPVPTTGPIVGGTIDEVPLPSRSVAPATPGLSAGPSGGIAASLPPLDHGPIPADLVPALSAARDDLPVIYEDGCHLDPADVDPLPCTFGDVGSGTTVVLFGDSHAAQWFPTFERLAEERHWRLISMTKSACASVDVEVWSILFGRPYDECSAWRETALARIAAEHPALVVMSNARRYSLTIDGAMAWSPDHEDVWSAGLRRTLDRLADSADSVLLIGDTTRMTDDPPVCLSAHTDDAFDCATPYATAVATKRLAEDAIVAVEADVSFVDPTPWTCFTDPCPVVIGRFLVYRDTHHLTATYARALTSRVEAVLPPGGP